MNEYIFGLEIDPLESGTYYVAIPLHCTLMHWFWSEKTADELIAATKGVFKNRHRIMLVSGAPAMFGRDNTTPVHTIMPNESLTRLHNDLYAVLVRYGVTFTEPDYVGPGYNPHVTTKDGKALFANERVFVKNAYLVENAQNDPRGKRKVSALFPFV